MNHTTSADGLGGFPKDHRSSPGSPDTRSDGFARHVETQDEWPSSPVISQRYGRHDAQGLLVDFEHTDAYTMPRKAPLPPPHSSPVSLSSRTSTTAADHSSSASEPLIAIPYESTSSADSQTPSGPQIRFSDAYRKWWLEQYSRPAPLVQIANKRPARGNWQGFWLARGTLRGCDNVIEQQGPGYWLARGTVKDAEQYGSAETSLRLWKRVANKIRSVSSEEK
ncbi:uncharacterized protein Z520_01596 [Fonsecaea multimorphosa CBS 102226]|uniref:Uncharacterized protein n=1 Tax=Fonsecaea multimorphosa CBS 102226 TaxID=1442371 RepID=A0A0D2L230_9EURO|nr:uncharacterized protein Z520_01596 [Fonsecaea multimorphosa CBS 102226]KIY03129.1 hypothetical protein Z520_01596 [Fonsecaea multimorphosa CBS 102226]OAL30375.1 hypothetical protein AYO22_01573 [Fonsecaea multimorphosa]